MLFVISNIASTFAIVKTIILNQKTMCRLFTLCTLALAFTLASCQGNQKKAQTEETAAEVKTATAIVTPEKVMNEGASLVNQEVFIEGTVTHVCRHGGKKCSLAGTTEGAFVQIMARGEIAKFEDELIGTAIKVKGTVKERRITKEMVAEQEKATQETMDQAEKSDAENKNEVKAHCSHSMHNINTMKQWMTDNNKEYYPVYFVEGVSFEKVQK